MIILLASLSLSPPLHISTSPASLSLICTLTLFSFLTTFFLGENQIWLRSVYFAGNLERDRVPSPSSSPPPPFWFVLNIIRWNRVYLKPWQFFKRKNPFRFHIVGEKREAVFSLTWAHEPFKEFGMGLAFRETTPPFFPEAPFLSLCSHQPLWPCFLFFTFAALLICFTPRSRSFFPSTGLFDKDENYWELFRIGWCDNNTQWSQTS